MFSFIEAESEGFLRNGFAIDITESNRDFEVEESFFVVLSLGLFNAEFC